MKIENVTHILMGCVAIMKRTGIMLFVFIWTGIYAPLSAQNVDDIIKMKKAGISEEIIQKKIGLERKKAEQQQNKSISLENKLGLGIESSLMNFGIGPIARYWITNNIGAQAGLAAMGTFTGYNLRGLYKFDKEVKLFSNPSYRPYTGLGYMSIGSKETMPGGGAVELEGSGLFFFFGLEGNIASLDPRLFLSTEFAYNAFSLDTVKTTIPGVGRFTDSLESDFSSFSLGFSLVYQF